MSVLGDNKCMIELAAKYKAHLFNSSQWICVCIPHHMILTSQVGICIYKYTKNIYKIYNSTEIPCTIPLAKLSNVSHKIKTTAIKETHSRHEIALNSYESIRD